MAIVERFLEIQSAISKDLIDIGEQRNLESEELKTLAENCTMLETSQNGLRKTLEPKFKFIDC